MRWSHADRVCAEPDSRSCGRAESTAAMLPSMAERRGARLSNGSFTQMRMAAVDRIRRVRAVERLPASAQIHLRRHAKQKRHLRVAFLFGFACECVANLRSRGEMRSVPERQRTAAGEQSVVRGRCGRRGLPFERGKNQPCAPEDAPSCLSSAKRSNITPRNHWFAGERCALACQKTLMPISGSFTGWGR